MYRGAVIERGVGIAEKSDCWCSLTFMGSSQNEITPAYIDFCMSSRDVRYG